MAGKFLDRFWRRTSVKALPMHYIIFPDGEDRQKWSREVDPAVASFIRDVITPALKPMSADDYFIGPNQILNSWAQWCYVVHGSDVFWCAVYDPGLVVVRFSPDGSLMHCELKSPHPQFGGREASEAELAAVDEGAPNYQLQLVFRAWDAQDDKSYREMKEWFPASDDLYQRWRAALASIDAQASRTP